MTGIKKAFYFVLFVAMLCTACDQDTGQTPEVEEPHDQEVDFLFGADLSYLNQILDHGGIYSVGGEQQDPYRIFAEAGTQLARFRIWHNPLWTGEIYGRETPLYNDLEDVESAIGKAKSEGMEILLDFHYSDVWADPGRQEIPAAWREIESLEVLQDSIYQYTYKTLKYLGSKGLFPEYVQIGNETNCGMLFTDAPENFPKLNVCEGNWQNFKSVAKAAVNAVHDAAGHSETKVIFHVADPENLDWWFENFTGSPNEVDFDIIGFSYYPLWHTTISLTQLESAVSRIKSRFAKDIMMLETAYPWTLEGNDDYTNIFGGQAPLPGFPYTIEGQREIMVSMSESMINAGGLGIIYWEPGWISSDMKDLWGTGSSWENCAFFDFEGNLHDGADYVNLLNNKYKINP
ncbi:arabinogalactan endo-1,4-beta-galactosidase [Belliella baltica DSM 15883]|uniref:Arabinogalactan endo-beta-1,4-galactanase n=1 Tax=Belliella baltica (strain DSM 15883 / CIP 108006 / LMG 21964 / BA134) TaxID=866536 RepID=I3Z4L3_BELBD|nr:glycosyl hydrolase 53 family protein [Belliella baltica]AFL84181.1 arabinogalactan endo-1,4-beta-galactosidase [Belliella baltica DSM 15883]